MSYQVGAACYTTPGYAGGAACAAFTPVTSFIQDGSAVRTVSCLSADSQSGALNLQISTKPVDGPEVIAYVSQSFAFPECNNNYLIKSSFAMVGLAITTFMLVYVFWKFSSYLSHGRADDA